MSVAHAVERCHPEQAALLTEIAHAAKRHWGYPERWIEAWRDALTVDAATIRDHLVWAARIEGEVAGFYGLAVAGTRVELLHLWVRPEFIGRGVGRGLFAHAIEIARQAGASRIEILSDPNAEGFYLRLGARRDGQVPAPVLDVDRYLPRLVYEVGPSN